MSKRLTDVLASVEPLTQQGPVRTWRLRDQIVKCVPITADVMEAQLPVLDGVQPWARFERLTRTERERLGLPVEHEWVMACRDYIDGSPLEGARDIDPALTCLKLATIVRDLHEVGVVHGDLHPGNVIIHDDRLWLIDVALFATTSGVEGHVLGNPSCMAPETWLKQPPTRKSDVYALGCVFAFVFLGRFAHSAASLAQWASAHRNGDFDLTKMPSATAALVRRMLSASPDDRPTLSEILLALEQTYALKSSSAVVVRESHDDAHRRALTPNHLNLVCDDAETRAIFFDDHLLRLQLCGWEAVELSPSPGDGPWTSLLAYLEEKGARVRLAGDLSNVIERLWSAIQAVCEGLQPGLCLLVRDLDRHGPDFRQWWDTDVTITNLLRLSHGGVGAVLELPGGSQDMWRAWRAQTLRSDVRTIPAPRFDELVEQSGGQPGALKLALNRELGHIATSRILDTQTLKAIGPWRSRAQRLLDQCAFGELAALCQTLVESAAKSSGRKQLVDVDEALAFWTTAAIRGARHPDALEALIAHLKAHPSQLLLAQLLHALGRHTEGTSALEGLPDTAEVAFWRAQLALSSGQSDAAKSHAEHGLTLPDHAARKEQLDVFVWAGAAMSGDPDAIAALESIAERLSRLEVPAVLVARTHAYIAIGQTRAGQLERATTSHLRALEIVEAAGLLGDLPTYLLNVGTAYHKQGRLGLAREHYARGIRTSGQHTRASTKALLLANQANVDLALGRLDEAEVVLEQAVAITTQHGLKAISVMCDALRGDLMVLRGDLDGARQHFETALQLPELSPYQHAELELSAAEVALRTGELVRTELLLDRARERIVGQNLDDLEPHQSMLRARMQWVLGGDVGIMAGIESFRRALQTAQTMGNHKLVLRQAPFLLEKLERESLNELAGEVVTLVHESRNIVGMGLTRELRREFFANLATPAAVVAVTPNAPAPPAPTPAAASFEPFYRMLSMNELILRSPSLDALMPEALDIAISLSQAERGFILLRIGNDLQIAASRDVDGRPIPAPHLEVSTTIAEEAARTGRSVLTLNAREDARFNASRSIHALELTSVLCVPIRDASGLLGAIYLDHRYSLGVFSGEAPRMMEAFGHQLALAITNARRLETLESERKQLKAAQAQLADLLSVKEAEVVGLEQRVANLSIEVERERASRGTTRFPEIIARSREMEIVLDRVERVAHAELPVVIYGESGVGKELIARAIHSASERSKGPFMAVNCGAVTEALLESELFGHKKGAFTGADSDRVGILKAADSGTVFLDEVGEMPASMQVKLLRVLQEKKVRPVGSNSDITINVRILAATHRDLRKMVESGDFREDLFYRIAPVTLVIPPLRERTDDIAIIAQKILEAEGGKSLSLDALKLLVSHPWRGNVRELQNVLRAATVFAAGDVISADEIRLHLHTEKPTTAAPSGPAPPRGRKPKISRSQLQRALADHGEDREAAADALGVSLRTLYRYLERWS